MSKWNTFDEYGRQAQLAPGLVAFLPLTLSFLAWAGTGSPLLKSVGAILTTSGGTYALAMIARNKGRVLQESLWQEWGGSPTIQLLRHRGRGNPVLRDRWHRCLERLLKRKFPTAEEENADPVHADAVYDAAVRVLRNERRDREKYPLVFRENVNYGFCRNLCALRGLGIAAAIIGSIASAMCGIYAPPNLRLLPLGCSVISGIILLLWLSLITHSWVQPPAQAYAERLLESCDESCGSGSTKSARPRKPKDQSKPTPTA